MFRKHRVKTLRRLEKLRLWRHTPIGSRIALEKEDLIAHVVAHSGFSSLFITLPPPTPPHSSKRLQQFTHVMLAYETGLI